MHGQLRFLVNPCSIIVLLQSSPEKEVGELIFYFYIEGSINSQWHTLSSTDKIKIDLFQILSTCGEKSLIPTNYNKLYCSLKWRLVGYRTKRAMFNSYEKLHIKSNVIIVYYLLWKIKIKHLQFFFLGLSFVFFFFLWKVILKLRIVEISCLVLIIRMNQTHIEE